MKQYLLLIIWLITSRVLYAQLPMNEQGNVVYSDVVQSEEKSKSELYENAKFWIVSTLKSGDNMVELDGTNSDQIVGTGNLLLNDVLTGWDKRDKTTQTSLNFKFIVFCKDGRYKYEISNFLLSYKDGNRMFIETGLEKIKPPLYMKKEQHTSVFETNMKSAINSSINDLISNFKQSMQNVKKDDW